MPSTKVEPSIVGNATSDDENPVMEDSPDLQNPVMEDSPDHQNPVMEDCPDHQNPVMEGSPDLENPVVEDRPDKDPVKETNPIKISNPNPDETEFRDNEPTADKDKPAKVKQVTEPLWIRCCERCCRCLERCFEGLERFYKSTPWYKRRNERAEPVVATAIFLVSGGICFVPFLGCVMALIVTMDREKHINASNVALMECHTREVAMLHFKQIDNAYYGSGPAVDAAIIFEVSGDDGIGYRHGDTYGVSWNSEQRCVVFAPRVSGEIISETDGILSSSKNVKPVDMDMPSKPMETLEKKLRMTPGSLFKSSHKCWVKPSWAKCALVGEYDVDEGRANAVLPEEIDDPSSIQGHVVLLFYLTLFGMFFSVCFGFCITNLCPCLDDGTRNDDKEMVQMGLLGCGGVCTTVFAITMIVYIARFRNSHWHHVFGDGYVDFWWTPAYPQCWPAEDQMSMNPIGANCAPRLLPSSFLAVPEVRSNLSYAIQNLMYTNESRTSTLMKAVEELIPLGSTARHVHVLWVGCCLGLQLLQSKW